MGNGVVMGKARIDLTGKQFGELTVLRPGKDRQQSKLWWCSCSCGSEYEYYTSNLRTGLSTRCRDCARYRSGRTHGQSYTSEYSVWNRIKRSGECCKRWLSFEQFLADVGPRPSAKHSFRRINLRRQFTPKNARWMLTHETTWPETGKFVTFNGKCQNLSCWARELGISSQALDQMWI